MACCLTTPSRYLNQCLLIIGVGVSFGIHQMEIAPEQLKISILDMSLKIDDLSLQPHFPGANDLSNMWDIQWSVCDPIHAG